MDTQQRLTEEELLESSKSLFDKGVEEVDGATRAKLRRARERALQGLAPRPLFGGARLWIPAAVAAAIVALVTLPLVDRGATQAETGFETMAAADLEILLGEEELEMLAELEFYEWLDLQGSGDGGGEGVDGVG